MTETAYAQAIAAQAQAGSAKLQSDNVKTQFDLVLLCDKTLRRFAPLLKFLGFLVSAKCCRKVSKKQVL